jgi:hypothetical protein
MTNNQGLIDAKTSVEGMISVIESHSPSEINGRWCECIAAAILCCLIAGSPPQQAVLRCSKSHGSSFTCMQV